MDANSLGDASVAALWTVRAFAFDLADCNDAPRIPMLSPSKPRTALACYDVLGTRVCLAHIANVYSMPLYVQALHP